MKEERDDGVSEVISFVVILAVLIITFAIWALYAIPASGEQMEEIHTVNIQMQFSEFKSGVENVWISNSTGVVRESVFMLGPDVSESGLEIFSFPLTRASGTLTVTANASRGTDTLHGIPYHPVEVRYFGQNMYTDGLMLEFSGHNNSVRAYGPFDFEHPLYVLPGSDQTKVLVPASTKLEVSGSGRAVIEYRLVGVKGDTCFFAMEVR